MEGAELAQRALLANRSPRYVRLNELERWVDTTQYDHRTHDWFEDGENAPPLRDRRPCIAYPIVRTAIDSNVDLCLGEGKFPAIELTDGDDGEGEASELSDDEREAVDRGIGKLVQLAKLKRVFRQALSLAQGCGSVAVICGVRNGTPFAECEQAKRCTVKRDAEGKVLELEVRYPYTVEVKEPSSGKWYVEARLYRRVIDATRDVTFKPVKAPEDGREVKAWVEDPERTVTHDLGFCPVVWYAHMVAATTAEQIDGRAIHAHCRDEIQALDIALSQWHRAAFYAGDPQMVESGVDNQSAMGPQVPILAPDPNMVGLTPGLGVAASSLNAEMYSTAYGGSVSDQNPITGRYENPASFAKKPARKKGSGIVWSNPSSEYKAYLLSLPGDALKCIADNAHDLRHKVSESLAVVFTDPEVSRFANSMSGKAQMMLRARQLDRCDQYRDDMDDGLICPVVHLLLRICKAVKVRSRAIMSALKAMSKLGNEPGITLRWGSYYAPDPEEEKQTADFLVQADKAVGGLPTKVKVRKLARALDVDNVDALVEEIDDERGHRDEVERDKAEATANLLMAKAHGDGTPVKPRVGGAAEPGAEGDAGGGGGAPAPAPAAQQGNPDRARSAPGAKQAPGRDRK